MELRIARFGGVKVTALNHQSIGYRFQINDPGQVIHIQDITGTSIIKQYNSVLAKGQWCSICGYGNDTRFMTKVWLQPT